VKDTNYSINCKGKLINIDMPKIMGIVNVTPDSFYDGGKISSDLELLNLAETHINDGADFIDVGGYSSKPGAENISEHEELSRVLPAIEAILHRFPNTLISIDTFRSNVADQALKSGAAIVNDISAFDLDANMPKVVKKHGAPYIIMHMQGTPQTMQNHPSYTNVTNEVIQYFSKKISFLKQHGINDIIIDPGFGFGKSLDHNFKLLNELEQFSIFNVPVLCGLSRKSMIWKTLNISPDDALNGTTVLNSLALTKGCNLLRVHDVKEAKQCVELFTKMRDV
jgi:dihydropteroate synthase